MNFGGITWGWIHKACLLSMAIKHSARYDMDSMPMEIFCAGKDSYVDANKEKSFAGKVPNCKLIEFPDAYHEVFNEKDSIRGTTENYNIYKPKTFMDHFLLFFNAIF